MGVFILEGYIGLGVSTTCMMSMLSIVVMEGSVLQKSILAERVVQSG
jgi:hypothetical protein